MFWRFCCRLRDGSGFQEGSGMADGYGGGCSGIIPEVPVWWFLGVPMPVL